MAEAAASIDDAEAAIAALRRDGAQHWDPVRLHYLETLAARAQQQPDAVRRLLAARLRQTLAAYRESYARAQADAAATITRALERHPDAAKELQHRLAAGDLAAVHRHVAALQAPARNDALADLSSHIAERSAAKAATGNDGEAASLAELGSAQRFRATWSRLSSRKRLTQALQQAPENAGPINAHMLVLRSLAAMRDISPEYLERFMSWADTLLWLEWAGEEEAPAAKGRVRQGRRK